MTTIIVIIIGTVFLVSCERIFSTLAVRRPASRDWIKNHRICHPNSISVIRMPMGVAGVLIWVGGWPTVAVLWFIFWMITDLTDGTIARNCDLVTEKGQWLDPLSDKCLYIPFLFLFALQGPLPLLWIVVLTAADIFGQVSRLFSAKKAANEFGKSKTALITTLLGVTAVFILPPGEIILLSSDFLFCLTVTTAILAILSVVTKMLSPDIMLNMFPWLKLACAIAAGTFLYIGSPLFTVFLIIFLPTGLSLFIKLFSAQNVASGMTQRKISPLAELLLYGIISPLVILNVQATGLFMFITAGIFSIAVVLRVWRMVDNGEFAGSETVQGIFPAHGALLAVSAALIFNDISWFIVPAVLLGAALMLLPLAHPNLKVELWNFYPSTLKVAVLVGLLLLADYQLAHIDLGVEIFESLVLATSAASAFLWKRQH